MSEKSQVELPFPLLQGLAKLIMKLGFAFEVRGGSHLQHCVGGLILAGNHTGYLDSLVVLAGCRRAFRFLMTDEVFGWERVGRWVPYANIIPIYRGREKRALVETVRYLGQAGVVCIFPEGKLSTDGALGVFNSGVAYLHEKSKVPIVPFAICGGFEAWPEGQRLPSFRKIVLSFGEPILPGEFADRSAITQALKQRVQALLDEGNAALASFGAGALET